ncbi:DNA-3-methyladenine glycosylase I [Candidatus Nitrospira salsa]|nr:MAG: DNA-3-methyladenine glycosylase I [Nitrospirales bacterium]
MTRCTWATKDLLIAYHDSEWGVPLHDDQQLFEFLILEGMQAGLSWHTILQKRLAFRLAFNNFEAKKISRYSPQKVTQLLHNADIIRNRLKITAALSNAKSYLRIQKTFESFDQYIWQFVDGKPIQNHWTHHQKVPCRSTISDAMSKDLKQRGFSFVGSTICYAFMQAIGMVNDHTTDCFRFSQLQPHHAPDTPDSKP